MDEAGQAWQNGYAKRVTRALKEKEIDLSEYENLDEARQQIGHFVDRVYGHKRIHSALG